MSDRKWRLAMGKLFSATHRRAQAAERGEAAPLEHGDVLSLAVEIASAQRGEQVELPEGLADLTSEELMLLVKQVSPPADD